MPKILQTKDTKEMGLGTMMLEMTELKERYQSMSDAATDNPRPEIYDKFGGATSYQQQLSEEFGQRQKELENAINEREKTLHLKK